MSKIEKQELTSMNIAEFQLQKLKELFPEAFTEANKVDWDRLRLTLGEALDIGKERFGMNWPGKADCFKTIQQPSVATLTPAREKSVNFDSTENLFIEGDNLEVLKLLQKSYLGKIKIIYFDPPYNTGNEFIYPDSYQENLETYLQYTGQIDADGKKFSTNAESDGRFHSKWLNMIYPRLFLAKNLLCQEGIVFISIGDDEIDNLKKICNELFGEENFLGCAVRVSKKANNQGDFWSPNFDYILTYAKDKNYCKPFFGGVNYVAYNLIEEDGPRKGEKYQLVRLYMTSLDPMRGCTNQRYYIECPDGSFVIPPGNNFPILKKEGESIVPQSGEDKVWRWSVKSFLDSKEKIVVKKTRSSNLVDQNGNSTKWNVFTKTYLNDVINDSSAKPNSLIEEHLNQASSHELNDLKIPFDFAKPSSLIDYLCEISRVEDGDIILDFFAGSGTTGHSTLMSSAYRTKLKVILVQIPEPLEEKTDAYKEGYKNIAELAEERLRRVIIRIQEQKNDYEIDLQLCKDKLVTIQTDLEKTPQLFVNGENSELDKIEIRIEELNGIISKISKADLGFKVFELQPSNFKIWNTNVTKEPEAIETALDLHIDHISKEAKQEAILFELLLKSGFELATMIEQLSLEGKTVYSIAEGELLICLEKELTHEVIKAMAERQPTRAICLDEGFLNNDQLKTNAVQIMKSKGVVNFRTV